MTSSHDHDLNRFMQEVHTIMMDEYSRISRRSSEDPATAGDEGEENWAKVLRGWLPNSFRVRTRGRILSKEGVASPQVDVIVLKDSYPKELLDTKLYLAAGVAAAFECKLTLTASDVGKAMETSIIVKDMYDTRWGTPYKELHAPVVFGLLAHSHNWKKKRSRPSENVTRALWNAEDQCVSHPRQSLDVLCLADVGLWSHYKMTYFGPSVGIPDLSAAAIQRFGEDGSAESGYFARALAGGEQHEKTTPIGALIADLITRIAWEADHVRDLADYYNAVMATPGGGRSHSWPRSIYSEEVGKRVEEGGAMSGDVWSEWKFMFT